MDNIKEFLQLEFWGIRAWIYAASLLSILLGFLGKRIAATIFQRLEKLAAKTRFKIDDLLIYAVTKPTQWALGLGGVFGALYILPIPKEPVNVAKFRDALFTVAYVWLAIWACSRLVDAFSDWWAEKAQKTESKLDDQLVPIVRRSLRVFLYIVGVVFILQNLGYSVGSLLAGFGLGGAALAFASKDMVSNFFGSLVIFLDKPFHIGDWIEMDGMEGTVEDVGLRTIKVRTFANSLITVPNSRLTTSTINNWSRMQKRRIKMTIGITYASSPQKVRELINKIKTLIMEDENLHHDFFLVNFDQFGPSSLDIFIYCFTRSTQWAEYLESKQEFMLKIMEIVKATGLDFAFPTQTLHIEGFKPGSDQTTPLAAPPLP